MFSCYSSETDLGSRHIDLKPKKLHSSKTNHHHSHSQNRFITGNVLHNDPHRGAPNVFAFVPSKKPTDEQDFERIRLKQEQERRYKLCAEHEKSLRERTNRQSSLKQSKNNDALKKFYESKAREFGLMNCTGNKQSSKAPSSSSSSKNFPENSEASLNMRSTPKKTDSRNSRDLIERIKSGYKIVKFIKYHITRLKTQRILSKLCKLRTFENHLISLKSTNNNDTNSLKDPILKILEQLDQLSCDDSDVVLARKNHVVKIAQNMMGSLNEKCLNINYSLDVY